MFYNWPYFHRPEHGRDVVVNLLAAPVLRLLIPSCTLLFCVRLTQPLNIYKHVRLRLKDREHPRHPREVRLSGQGRAGGNRGPWAPRSLQCSGPRPDQSAHQQGTEGWAGAEDGPLAFSSGLPGPQGRGQ